MFKHSLKSIAGNLLLIFVLSLFAACGGGSSDSDSSTTGGTPSSPSDSGSSGSGDTTGDTSGTALAIDNTTPSDYVWGVLDEGEDVYIDRSYIFTDIPTAYQGLNALRTANDDKTSVGASTISFDVNKPVYVYVAHVSPDIAGWLDSWTFTGEYLQSNVHTLTVYRTYFPAGTVTLGGNHGDTSSSMYVVFVEEYSEDSAGSSPSPVTGSATLSWLPPTTNADGTALSDLAGYRIFYGTTPGIYPFMIEIDNVGITSYTVTDLSAGTYHFVVTAYDDAGNVSENSNAVSKVIGE